MLARLVLNRGEGGNDALATAGSGEAERDANTVPLFCTTTTVILPLHTSLTSHRGLKSGQRSPVNDRGAVRISVMMRMREKYFSISCPVMTGGPDCARLTE